MSWLVDIAGKAEELLNKVDKQAGKALNTPEQNKQQRQQQQQRQQNVSAPSYNGNGGTVSSNRNRSPVVVTPASPSSSSANIRGKQQALDTDEQLLDYLNAKSDAQSSKRNGGGSSMGGHSRQSSTASMASIASSRASTRSYTEHAIFDLTDGSSASSINPSPRPMTPEVQGVNAEYNGSVDDAKFASILMENKLLKNEITALNTEMISLMERSRDSQEMVSAFDKRERMLRLSQSENDEIIRNLRDKQEECISRLSESEDKVIGLEKRLDESKNQLSMKHDQFVTISADRERILNDHTSVSGVQSQAMESLKSKLIEMESSLNDKDRQCQGLKMEAIDKQTTIDQEKHDLSQNLSSAQTKLQTEKNVILDLNTQLKSIKQSNDQIKKELSAYKDKATRILQSKDKLLATLRDSTTSDGVITSNSSLSIELSESIQERDSLRDEIIESHAESESLKVTIQDYESQLQMLSESNADQVQSMQDVLNSEKQRKEDLEIEINKIKLELRYANDELHKQRLSANRQMTDRDSQIEVLRNQLTAKSLSTSTTGDLERQIHSLTERLIQKQGLLEVLNTEKNSLVLQLERTEKQYRESENAAMRNSTTLNMNNISDHTDNDDIRQRLPTFLRSAISDGQVTRRVKLAANTIDRFSVRLGVFLRRYPIARIFVIIYMALLHLWVTTVILTYQPEIHSNDFNPKQ